MMKWNNEKKNTNVPNSQQWKFHTHAHTHAPVNTCKCVQKHYPIRSETIQLDHMFIVEWLWFSMNTVHFHSHSLTLSALRKQYSPLMLIKPFFSILYIYISYQNVCVCVFVLECLSKIRWFLIWTRTRLIFTNKSSFTNAIHCPYHVFGFCGYIRTRTGRRRLLSAWLANGNIQSNKQTRHCISQCERFYESKHCC